MQILNYIFHAKELEDKEPQFWDLLDRIPFMEAEMRDGTVGADKLAKLTFPRFMKTHTVPNMAEAAGKTSQLEGHTSHQKS